MADSTRPSDEDKQAERKAKKAAQMREARKADPEKARAKDRARYQASKARALRKNKAWRDRNKKSLQEKAKKRRANNIERERARTREWAAANRDRKRAYDRAYHQANRELRTARERERYKSDKEVILARNKAWREANRDSRRPAIREYAAKRRAENECLVLIDRARSRVRSALLRCRTPKRQQTLKLIGCTAVFLRAWIESKFLPGMTWGNIREWHVDHIIPLSAFDLTDECQQAAAFHYTNLQPLWAKDNLRKSNKVEGQNLFGFAYAARIADKASATPKKRRKRGG